MDLISVIVPVYNVEQYLDRCIQSIVEQTYTNLEIILVEDGSPDQCPEICDAWEKKDYRVKVIHKKNGGLSDARNAGIKFSSGDYIGFVDSDDWIAPEMYEKLISVIKRDQSDIAACGVEIVWEDGTPNKILIQQSDCVLDGHTAQAELLNEAKLKQPVWYKLYHRKTIQGIFFEVGKYHEDVFWSYQVIGNARKVSVISDIGYYYWQRKNSIMGERYSAKRLDALEAYTKRYEYIKEYYPELASNALCAIWTGCIYHGQMTMKYMFKEEQKKIFQVLENICRRYPIRCADYKGWKISHQLWLNISRISLKLVCRIKNILNIGF